MEERFFDFALNFVDPAKAHPVGDFRRKKEIVRARFPVAKGAGRCAQSDNLFGRFGMNFHIHEAAGPDKNGPRPPTTSFSAIRLRVGRRGALGYKTPTADSSSPVPAGTRAGSSE